MDLDAYSAAHRDEWDELARLSAKRRFSGADADALIDHFQSGASELSAIKTTSGQSAQGDRLSLWLFRARLRFTGASANVMSQLPRFFGAQLPAALFRIRWLCLIVTAASLAVAALYFLWALNTPGVLAHLGTAAQQQQYADHDFVSYYSEHPAPSFFGRVWTNNAWIAAGCIAFGITGVYAPYLLFQNAQSLGMSGALMAHNGQIDTFFLYIAPHGQLELYSIFTAGAAGLAIFWSWISPGARTRAGALAEEGRALITVAIGLICSLLVSGLIEGFVTGQAWPWPVKIGIGTVAVSAFLFYQWVVGRWAVRAGETGDLDEFDAGAKQLIAA
ncbi:stage II sporulation protein M [Parafrigoribacterium humi]|jgi:uncharacterized membrane protein SpoIIM required for sporulation|uniref:stage II sporulation protein M n=1 Tax=Parafrigoribacterium humi TaxID=3144664 RepID=UPI0032EB58FF